MFLSLSFVIGMELCLRCVSYLRFNELAILVFIVFVGVDYLKYVKVWSGLRERRHPPPPPNHVLTSCFGDPFMTSGLPVGLVVEISGREFIQNICVFQGEESKQVALPDGRRSVFRRLSSF